MIRTTDAAYRPDIDGLRAVAVVSVVLFHAFPAWLPGGFVGVDVFFAISGYLITGILLRQETISISGFYMRRVRRIFPALLLVLTACLAFGALTSIPVELQSLGKHTAAGALSVANLVLWSEAGYFAAAAQTQPLLHLWSLGVEEQYYLVWPWFVAALRGRRAFVPLLWAAGLASFVHCVWTTRVAASTAFYMPSARLWELAAGSGLAVWHVRRTAAPGASRAAELAAMSGSLLLAAAFALTRDGRGFPGAWPLLPVAGALLIMHAGPATRVGRVLGARPCIALGLISYPLYLWHWPLLSFGRTLLGDAGMTTSLRLGAIALACALAAATYSLVELRVRTRRASWRSSWAWVAGMSLVAVAGYAAYRADGLPGRVEAVPLPQRLQPHEQPACPPALQGGGLDGLNYCRRSQRRDGPAQVALVGDSHADHLFDALADADGRRWLFAGNSSCPPVSGVLVQTEQPGCLDKFQRILRYLASSEGASIEQVVLLSFGGYALDTDYAADHLANHLGPSTMIVGGERTAAAKTPAFERGLDAFVSQLIALGKRVTLIEDWPEFPFLPNECASRPALGTWLRERLGNLRCSIPRAAVEARQAAYAQLARRIASRHPQLQLLPMLDRVCTRELCSIIDERGQLLYDDSHHVSRIGATQVAASLAPELGRGK